MSKRHPIQPIEKDEHGTLRFKVNEIVRHLLDAGPFDMNTIAFGDFTNEDRQQFAQLIGYSLSGYGELRSYVDDDAYGTAERMAGEGLSEDEAKIQHLQCELDAIRRSLRDPVARLFGVHRDDLNNCADSGKSANQGEE